MQFTKFVFLLLFFTIFQKYILRFLTCDGKLFLHNLWRELRGCKVVQVVCAKSFVTRIRFLFCQKNVMFQSSSACINNFSDKKTLRYKHTLLPRKHVHPASRPMGLLSESGPMGLTECANFEIFTNRKAKNTEFDFLIVLSKYSLIITFIITSFGPLSLYEQGDFQCSVMTVVIFSPV